MLYEFCLSSALETKYAQELFTRTIAMIQNHIKPIWIFDPCPDPSYFPIGAGPEHDFIFSATEKAIANGYEILRLMGIPSFTAVESAEKLCVKICNEGRADYISSETLDCFLFGPEKLIVGLNKRRGKVFEVKMTSMLAKLGFTTDQLVELCILYQYISVERFPNFTRCYKIIHEFGTIENAIQSGKLQPFDYTSAKEWLENLKMVESTSNINYNSIQWTECESEDLCTFLTVICKLDKRIISTGLHILEGWKPQKAAKHIHQTRIDEYFKERKTVPGIKLEKEIKRTLLQKTIKDFFSKRDVVIERKNI